MLRDVFATLDDLNPSTLVASQGLQNFRINDNRDLPYSLYGPFPATPMPRPPIANFPQQSAARSARLFWSRNAAISKSSPVCSRSKARMMSSRRMRK